jgi:recombination protein RecT
MSNGAGGALGSSQSLTIAQELGSKVSQFEAALAGSGISPKQFVRVIMTAININPDLLNCDRRSLMNAAMRAASDGLKPDGIDGALVPFEGKVTWMPMISGIRKKVRRSGEVTSWDVTVVCAKDHFDYELGDDPFIKHKPWMAQPLARADDESAEDYNKRLRAHIDRGPATYVYSVANIKGGGKSRDVMSRTEVELVRDTYARKSKKGEFSPAWRKSFPEMMKKTVARRHAKQLPMSSDILALLSRDDDLYDLGEGRGDRIQAPRDLSDRLDVLSGYHPETGEFADSVDEVSTPSSQSAAPDDISAIGSGDEGAAQPSGDGSPAPEKPEPVAAQQTGSPAPPGATQTPAPAPGGTPDLLADEDDRTQIRPSVRDQPVTIEQRGEEMAKKGTPALERWVNELPPDEMARISLAQLKAWRGVANKAGT